MDKWRIGLLCGLCMLALSALVYAQDPIIYQHDFTNDPMWVESDDGDTLSDSTYYWDATVGNMFARQINRDSGGLYCFFPLSYNCGSFVVEWEQMMESCAYACGLPFGVFTGTLNDQTNDHLKVHFSNDDQGHTTYLTWLGQNGAGSAFEQAFQWQFGVWYHFRLEYDAGNESAHLEVSLASGGGPLFTLDGSGVGPFDGSMRRLGTSNLRDGTFQVPGAQATGRFDNVWFSARGGGDVNCDCKMTSSDIIYLVNHVFKGDVPPCFDSLMR